MSERVTEQEKERLNTRIAGVSLVVFGFTLMEITHAAFGAGPPITYPLPQQVTSALMFLCVYIPLAWLGTTWLIHPEDRSLLTGDQS